MTYGPARAAAGGSKPGGGTAVAAGVFAGLIGLWHVVGLIAGVVTVAGESTARDVFVGIGLNALVAAVSLIGAVALLARVPAGRVMVVVGCVLAIAMYGFLALLASPGGLSSWPGIAALAIVCVPAVAGLVLAVLPPTGRWLRWGRPAVPRPSYQPQPGGRSGAS